MNKYFSKSEFECKCGCGFDEVNPKLLKVLTEIRTHFDQPVVITSGNRCEKHNKYVGGVKNSKHIKGIAADIKVKGIDPEDVLAYLDSKYSDTLGVGVYSSWTHVDVRKFKARW